MNVKKLKRVVANLPDSIDHLPVRIGALLEESAVIEIRATPNPGAEQMPRYLFIGYDPGSIDDGTETGEIASDEAAEEELGADELELPEDEPGDGGLDPAENDENEEDVTDDGDGE